MMSPDAYRSFRMDAPIHVQLRRASITPPGGGNLLIDGRVWRIFRDGSHRLFPGRRIRFSVPMSDPGDGPPAPGGTIYHSWSHLGRARWVEAFLEYYDGEFHLVHSQIAGIRGPTWKPVCDPAAEGFCCVGNL
jgi:hypothetical protein